jgi:Secretion system C-terminal sorting domain
LNNPLYQKQVVLRVVPQINVVTLCLLLIKNFIMKSRYLFSFKILFISLLGIIALTTKAQTTLVKGDIAYTGYVGNGTVAGNDQFSFVLLRNITANTVIIFTDNAWLRTSSTTGSFRTGEGTVTWTSNAAYNAGAEIKIEITGGATATATYAGLGGSAGSATGTVMPSFSANGDQIIAYQGTTAAPTFICAIHMNSYNAGIAGEPVTNTTDWEGAYSTANSCGLPALTSVSASNFLTNGVDAMWIPANPTLEYDNSRFTCTGTLNTVAGIRTAIYTVANWTAGDDDAPGFTLPTNCNYLGVFIPVQLISFQAQNNISDIIAKWQVTNEINFSHYELERSFDNKNFDKIANLTAKGGSGIQSYSYSDKESVKNSAAVIYYRLKLVDIDNKFNYSEIVSVRNKKGAAFIIDNLANPVKDRVSFTLTTKTAGIASIQLSDVNGKIVATRSLQLNAGNNAINLSETAGMAKGVYFLKVITTDGNTVTRLIK